jgi:hypothetical protein
MIYYGEHAEFQLALRNIDKAWVEATLRKPDATDTAKFILMTSFFVWPTFERQSHEAGIR